MIKIKFKRIRPEDEDIPIPRYMSKGASGMDVFAANQNTVFIYPGCDALIPIGYACQLPPGFEAQIRPRSGLGLKNKSLAVFGTIDNDYRGEIKVHIFNFGIYSFKVERGMRIAQLVPQMIERLEPELVDELSETDRGDGGFGHTGV